MPAQVDHINAHIAHIGLQEQRRLLADMGYIVMLHIPIGNTLTVSVLPISVLPFL